MQIKLSNVFRAKDSLKYIIRFLLYSSLCQICVTSSSYGCDGLDFCCGSCDDEIAFQCYDFEIDDGETCNQFYIISKICRNPRI